MSARRNILYPLIAAVSLAVIGGLVASRASGIASSFHARLNVPRPSLGAARPMLLPGPTARSRRVVIVIIDGLRLDSSFGHPWLDSMRRIGVEAVGHAHFPTWSRPNQVAVVTGVPPVASGVRSNDYGFPVALDSLMDRANAVGKRSAYVADMAFGMARMFHADFEAVHYVPWPGGLEKAIHLVLRQGYPVVLIIPGTVDEAGHQFGADSDAYREAVAELDRTMAEALAGLDLSRDTLIVTADHGHTAKGGHGGIEREVVEVPVILAGAGIRAGAAIGDVELIDLAPTAAALLGLSAPGHSLGKTIVHALDLEVTEQQALARRDHQRVARNQQVHDRATQSIEERARRVRAMRLVGVAVALMIAALVLVALLRIGALQLDWRVLVIGLPAFPLTYYVLLELLGGSFSLSMVPDRLDALSRLFDFAIVATAAQVVASWIALHDRHVLRERLAAAVGLTSCGLLVACVPAGILWAVYDPDSHPLLASSRTLVLAPATWVAVAFVALASAFTLGLEIVVFFARGLDPRLRLRRLEIATERVRAQLDVETSAKD